MRGFGRRVCFLPISSRRISRTYGVALATLAALVVTAVVLSGFLLARADGVRRGQGQTGPKDDLEEIFASFAARLNSTQSYRDPYPDERRLAMSVLDSLTQTQRDTSAATAALTHLGFTHTEAVDPVTGRRYAMYADRAQDGRAWGIVLVDLSAPTRLVVEVPHPNFDLRTERMGVQLFRLTPGSVLLMAGAHRKAGNGAADVAHNDQSFFNALATEAAKMRLPQIQLHGFADENLPGQDAVVSTGTTRANPPAIRVAERLQAIGLTTCHTWENRCGRLEGTLNVQAQEAERMGSVFIHLEANWRIRGDDQLRSQVVKALAAADISAG
jgi:hypothetical protein